MQGHDSPEWAELAEIACLEMSIAEKLNHGLLHGLTHAEVTSLQLKAGMLKALLETNSDTRKQQCKP